MLSFIITEIIIRYVEMYFRIMVLVSNFDNFSFSRNQGGRPYSGLRICSTGDSGALAWAVVGNKIRFCIFTLIWYNPTFVQDPFPQGKRFQGGVSFITQLGQGLAQWCYKFLAKLSYRPDFVFQLLEKSIGVVLALLSYLCFLIFRHLEGFYC